jgi:hypothetical protein
MASAASVLAGLNVASAVANIASAPFNTMNAVDANRTAADNAAASAAALETERANFTRIYDRETRQLAADQTISFIMSGLEFAGAGTPESVMSATASERAADKKATLSNYSTAIDNARRAERAADKAAGNAFLGGAVQMASTIGTLALFSDERLKERLIAVGRSKTGLTIYLGRYTAKSGLDDGKLHLFLLAQEVQKVRPNAVKSADNGYLMVDYTAALI